MPRVIDAAQPAQPDQPDQPAQSPPPDSPSTTGELAGLGYEAARDELAAIVARLEGGQLGLEDSIRLWERGEELARHCTALLDGAQATISGATEETQGTEETRATAETEQAADRAR